MDVPVPRPLVPSPGVPAPPAGGSLGVDVDLVVDGLVAGLASVEALSVAEGAARLDETLGELQALLEAGA